MFVLCCHKAQVFMVEKLSKQNWIIFLFDFKPTRFLLQVFSVSLFQNFLVFAASFVAIWKFVDAYILLSLGHQGLWEKVLLFYSQEKWNIFISKMFQVTLLEDFQNYFHNTKFHYIYDFLLVAENWVSPFKRLSNPLFPSS